MSGAADQGGGAARTALWALGVIYALAVAYGLFVLLGLFQVFGVADPALLVMESSPWPRNSWNWISWNVLFSWLEARPWWHGLWTNDFRLPLQVIASVLALSLADWVWRMTLGRLWPR
ncbi:MAG: hypothetical protein AAGM38_12825 [Pseudomonadota bacterium]